MLTKLEIDLMKEAYTMMYIIENSLRTLIVDKMEIIYGINWYRDAPRKEHLKPYNKNFDRLHFHELIPFLFVYPCFKQYIPDKFIQYLHRLIPLRNKIAHNIFLSNSDYERLSKYFRYIVEYISEFTTFNEEFLT